MNTKKLRGQAQGEAPPLTRLKGLARNNQEVRDELWTWRNETGATNTSIRKRILAEHGIAIPSDPRLSEFWSWLDVELRNDRRNQRFTQFEETLKARCPALSREQVREAGLTLFLTDAVLEEDRKGFVDVGRLDLDERTATSRGEIEREKISISREKLKLMQDKAAKADRATAVEKSDLTPEEKAARYRQIFGMG